MPRFRHTFTSFLSQHWTDMHFVASFNWKSTGHNGICT